MHAPRPDGRLRIGIIADGHRRWAKQNGKRDLDGYLAGAGKGLELLEAGLDAAVEHLVVYAASKRNLEKRGELPFIELPTFLLGSELHLVERLARLGVSFSALGDLRPLPPEATAGLTLLERLKPERCRLHCTLLVNYSLEWDIRRAAEHPGGGSLTWSEPIVPPLDLIIRSAGERRLSGFLPLQSFHSELAFIDPLWPDVVLEEIRFLIARAGSHTPTLGA